MGTPNRWMHLRHPKGFTAEQFECFAAHCRIWRGYVEAVLAEWEHFEKYPAPAYEFFEPELSADRKTATLPIGGAQTTGSRAEFENARSRLLWERFPIAFAVELEEGLTEPHSASPTGHATNWRRALKPESGGQL